MFTRLKTNVTQYPRLFKVTLGLLVLTTAWYFLPVVFTFRAELVIAAVLAFVIFEWINLDAGRTQIMLDILARFEGRDVCTIDKHTCSSCDKKVLICGQCGQCVECCESGTQCNIIETEEEEGWHT